ncbi:MAG: hypothetical protein ACLQD9_04535 [Thermoplasmata archaeon]
MRSADRWRGQVRLGDRSRRLHDRGRPAHDPQSRVVRQRRSGACELLDQGAFGPALAPGERGRESGNARRAEGFNGAAQQPKVV